MDATFERKYHRLEDDQWWFRARRDIICHLVGGLGLNPASAILEVGCSTGPLLAALGEAGYDAASGIDISSEAIAQAKQRGLNTVQQMDAAQLEFADQSFDLVIASDVLEHIEQDRAAILEWKRVLKPGGSLLIFVPAFDLLWSRHDEANHHIRRYSASRLRRIIGDAELAIERISYWNLLLTLPAIVLAAITRLLPTRQSVSATGRLVRMPGAANELLFRLVWLENQILHRMNFVFGTSIFVIAIRIR
jgi:SAM-dependent methyltransferase